MSAALENQEDKASPELNSPKLDKAGNPTQKAISSYKQAHAIAKAFFDADRDGRVATGGKVEDVYDAPPPYKLADLRASKQEWRNNYSERFLPSTIDRVKPQLGDPIRRADSLTYASLPADYDDGAKKTKTFRKEITDTIRAWDSWSDLVDSTAQETYKHGSAVLGFLDKYEWRPKFFRFDQRHTPPKCPQISAKATCFVLGQDIPLHEFMQLVKDSDAAKAEGYDTEGCIKAINDARPPGESGDETKMEEVDRRRAQGGLEKSYGEKGGLFEVRLWHVFVQEWEGGVAVWTVDRKGNEVRHIERIFDTMDEAATFFTLQTANYQFEGSIGAGRMLGNLSRGIDKLSCFGADCSYLSGMPVVRAAEKDINQFSFRVVSPFIVIPGGYEVSDARLQFKPEDITGQIKRLKETGEAIAGAFIPPAIDKSGTANTKIEAAQRAERELAVKDGVLGRWFRHVGDLITQMQRKICCPINMAEAVGLFAQEQANNGGNGTNGNKPPTTKKNFLSKIAHKIISTFAPEKAKEYEVQPESKTCDAEAVNCILNMMRQGLTPVEIAMLAACPAHNNGLQSGEQADQRTVDFLSGAAVNNPLYDQPAVERMRAELVIGPDRANEVLLPEEPDPNEQAQIERQQLMELGHMEAGIPMPVSSMDDHKAHLGILLPHLETLMTALGTAPDKERMETAKMEIEHALQHVQFANIGKEQKEQAFEGLQNYMKAIEVMEKQLAKQAAELPPQLPGGQPLIDPALALEAKSKMDEHEIKRQELDIKQQQVDVSKAKLKQDADFKAADLATSAMTHVADAAAKAQQEEQAAAREDIHRNADRDVAAAKAQPKD